MDRTPDDRPDEDSDRRERTVDRSRSDIPSSERATLASSTEPPSPLDGAGDSFPVENWSRYRFIGLVGRGAAGDVYKAEDLKLDRTVALKFLHTHDPELIQRFRREAQSQARVEHENICPVFDVGQVSGRHYIAMHFVEGESLRSGAPAATLEQKIKLIKEVAEALHAAHRAGLVHRDVKPGNIMIERTEEGGWKPYVSDFGLAHQTDSPGMTMSGAVLGTPEYMPPEQARGDVHDLDRRSDVYGIGATLYSLLARRPPFQGSLSQLLDKVQKDVPKSLREINSSIPQDLDSIAMKCLRKNPDERYGSARELAEDLGRYIDGEPVLARRTTLAYRLRMKAAKHRLEVVTAAVGGVLLLGALAWGGYTAIQSAQKARLAQAFGQQVERIDSIARFAALVPLHDTRPDQELIRERMTEIEDRMSEVGKIATGPGHHALGRGHMALEDWETALTHLQTAWRAGSQTPETAYALGRTLGEIYWQALRDTDGIRNSSQREAERERVKQLYREPALEYLRRSAGLEIESPAYAEALIAFYEERLDDALESARRAAEGNPWLYEAIRLEGEIFQAQAAESRNKGERDAALDALALARRAFNRAVEVSPSASGVYVALGYVDESRMRMESDNRGADVPVYFEDGMRAVELALEADSRNTSAYTLRADLLRLMGQYEFSQGRDPDVSFRRSIAAADDALALDPDDASAYGELGATWAELAKYEQERGQDPSESYAKAIRAHEEVRSRQPAVVNHSRIGVLFKNLARYEMGSGRDPHEWLAKSVAAYEDAIAVDPGQFRPYHNLGVALTTWAEYEEQTGADPAPMLNRAIGAFQAALAVHADHLGALYQLGYVHNVRARYAVARGQNPSEHVRAALDALGRTIEIRPDWAYLAYVHNGRGMALQLQAAHERSHGLDPEASYQSSVVEFESAVEANANDVHSWSNVAALHVARAEHGLDVGGDPSPSLREAVAACEEALRINPSFAAAHEHLAGVYRVRAIESFDRPGGEFDEYAAQARIAFERALEINPNHASAHDGLGRVSTLTARRMAKAGLDPGEAFDDARRHLDRALELDRKDVATYLAIAELCRRKADWLETNGLSGRADLDAGLLRTDEALAMSEHLAEALALKAALLACAADQKPNAQQRNEALNEARNLLEQALSKNANLTRRYEKEVQRIHTALARS